MLHPPVKFDQCVFSVLCLMACWYFSTGEVPYFKGDNGKTEMFEVKNGTKECRLQCTVETHAAKTRWLKDGNIIKSSASRGKYRIRNMKNLKIRNIRYSDKGVYVCQTYNTEGSVNKTIYLNVLAKDSSNVTDPGIGKEPAFTHREEMNTKQTYSKDSPPKLVCKADGVPTPTVVWLRNDDFFKIMSGELLDDDFSYKVKTPDASDSTYTCIVSNKYGLIREDFDVTFPGSLRSGPVIQDIKNQTVVIGGKLDVKCEAVCQGRPEFRLVYVLLNGSHVPVKIGGNVKETLDRGKQHDDTDQSARWYSILWTFENVSFADERRYACTAKNLIGPKNKVFHIFVEPKANSTPNSPTQFNDSSVAKSNNFIIIMCTFIAGAVLLSIIVCVMCVRRRKRRRRAYFTRNKDFEIQILRDPPYGSSPPVISGKKYRTRLSSNLSQGSAIPYDDDWDISRENVRLLGTIGEGAFGTVLKAEAYIPRLGPMRLIVAVKTLKDDATDVELADLISELDVMKKIGPHKNIINLIGCVTQNGPLLMIVEFAPNGNLREYLRDRRPHRQGMAPAPRADEVLSLRDFISFSYQVARGMEYLSSVRCIHRDLAARNVLVGDDKVMKIADFGLARDIHKIDYYRKTTDGRLPVKWMALEALFDRVYTAQSDVWAFGVLTWEIFTFGGTPYPSVPLEKLFELLKSGYRMERPVNCPPELYDLLLRCWLEEPGSRPNFREIVKELNQELESMTTEEYIDVEAPLLSPMSPRTISESGPNHGLSSVRQSFGDVFVSEENDAEEADDVIGNEESDPDKGSTEEKSNDSGLFESEGNSEEAEEIPEEDDEDEVVLLWNGSEKKPKQRVRKESHV